MSRQSLSDVVLSATARSNKKVPPSEAVPGSAEIAGPIEFIEAPWGLGMQLFPVQRIIIKAYYGIPLDDVVKFDVRNWRAEVIAQMTEAEYLKYLFAEKRCNIDHVEPGQNMRQMLLAIGRRSGKTTISACIAAYETYKLINLTDPQRYYGLPASNNIQLISVATDREQAGLLYQEVSGHFGKCQFFKPYTANNTQAYARFQTPRDIERFGAYSSNPAAKATIKVTFRSCIAKGLRGAGNILVILDEVAHFTDSGQSSAEEVYKAVIPSQAAYTPKDPNNKFEKLTELSDGRSILISSPLGKQGLFYKRFMQGMAGGEGAKGMLCIQAPSWEVNLGLGSEFFMQEYYTDPATFFVEFGAEFSDSTLGWFARGEEKELEAALDPNLRYVGRGLPRVAYHLGLDIALKGDGCAAAIGHQDEHGVVILDAMEEMKAGEGPWKDTDRLEFDDVADWVADICKRFYIMEGIFDQWAGIPFEQALQKRGLSQIKSKQFRPELTSEIFQNFKNMLWNKRLRLPNYPLINGNTYSPLIQELLELQAEQRSKYITIVQAPNIDGKHDDRADSLVRMVWLASQRAPVGGHFATGGRVVGPRAAGINLALSRMKQFRSGSHESRMVPKANRFNRFR